MNPLKILVLIFSIFFGFVSLAHADAQANVAYPGETFFSENKKAKAIVDEGLQTFTVFVDGKKQWVSDPNTLLSLGTFFVSNDGHFVTWILRSAFLTQEEVPHLPITALIFYKDGKALRSYTYEALIVRPELVGISTSHTHWLTTMAADPKNPKKVLFEPDGSKLRFETTSFRRYEFNPQTGEGLKAEDSPIYVKADLIIYAFTFEVEPQSAKGCWVTVKEPRFVKGEKTNGPLRLLDPNCTLSASSGATTLVLSKKEEELQLVSQLDGIYNRIH